MKLLGKVLVILFVLVLWGYIRHLLFVNVNVALGNENQTFEREINVALVNFFKSLPDINTIEKVLHFVCFGVNLLLSLFGLKWIFALSLTGVKWLAFFLTGVFMFGVLLYFFPFAPVQAFARWLVVNMQGVLLFMILFPVFLAKENIQK